MTMSIIAGCPGVTESSPTDFAEEISSETTVAGSTEQSDPDSEVTNDAKSETTTTSTTGGCAFDVALLIDSTVNSIFDVKEFLKSVSNLFSVAPTSTRISAALLSSEVTLLFNFTTYTSNLAVNNAIDGISGMSGSINTKEGLDYVSETMFTTENGDRSDVSDILIALLSNANTDGVDVSAQNLKDNGVYVMIVEERVLWDPSLLIPVANVHNVFRYTSTLATTALDAITNGLPCIVVNGNWNNWSDWSSCSASFCGTGTQSRNRTCNNPEPSNGGNECEGSSVESISCEAAEECCAPKVFDVAFLIDTTISYFTKVKDFFKLVTNIFEIGPSRTRISVATISKDVTLLFNFTTYTTNSTIIDGINGMSYTYSSNPNSKVAMDFARGTMFTAENGARSDVTDVIITVLSNENSEEVDVSAQKLKDKGVYLMVVEQSNYNSLLEPLADVYIDFSVYNAWSNVAFERIRDGFPCNYFCATSFFALDTPSSLSSGNDSSSGFLYLMTDDPFKVSCCGATSVWEFFAVNSGTIEMIIFRQIAENSYYLVGSTKIIVPEEYINTTVSYSLTASERIAISEGDVLGWYTSGANIIGHADCTTSSRSDCPQNNKRLSRPDSQFTTGETIDFSSAETIQDKGYSIKMATINNTELILTAIQNETEVEENTPIGYKIMYFSVKDTDLNDNITLDLSGDDSLFVLSELENDRVTLNLKSRLPTGGGVYVLTVTGTDSCQHTASATVTVSTYNAPPIINNLPYIHEISESTKSSIHLYTINVTDATNDPICCTLSHTLPHSFNFKIEFVDGVYSIWTVDEPAFAYNDIDAYRVFICCQDPYGSSYSYFILRLTEDKTSETYTPPGWFYTALAVSMIPISIMTLLTCASVVLTMFFLDGEIKVQERAPTVMSETIPDVDDFTNEEDENHDSRGCIYTTEVKTVNESIHFRNLYNNEVVKIPVWKGPRNKGTLAGNTLNAWQHVINKQKVENAGLSTGDHLQSTTGDGFGVELKLFHYGGKATLMKTEEEKSVDVFQKKNTIKEKWKDMIAKAEKKKTVTKKSSNFRQLSGNRKSKGNEIENTEGRKDEKQKDSKIITDHNEKDKERLEVADTNENIKTDVSRANAENKVNIEDDIDDILGVFDEVVDAGTPAAETVI